MDYSSKTLDIELRSLEIELLVNLEEITGRES
jgi:hypothetical protein